MNQVTNLIQWKNLTQEQKDDFDFENYRYTVQTPTNTKFFGFYQKERPTSITDFGSVYRLVIEHDKWYTYFSEEFSKKYTVKGSEFVNPDGAISLRPAKPDEIPQQEKTLEQKIKDKWSDKEVVLLKHDAMDVLRMVSNDSSCFSSSHTICRSIKGFYKYVYDQDGDLIKSLRSVKSWKGKTIQPLAVLFEEVK